jgi:hypothetical protein
VSDRLVLRNVNTDAVLRMDGTTTRLSGESSVVIHSPEALYGDVPHGAVSTQSGMTLPRLRTPLRSVYLGPSLRPPSSVTREPPGRSHFAEARMPRRSATRISSARDLAWSFSIKL